MTEEEAKGLKVGDRVLVVATITRLGRDHRDSYAMAVADRMPEDFCTYYEAIHSVLPRPLEAGDRLKTKICDQDSVCIVLWLDERGGAIEWADKSRGCRDRAELETWERVSQ